MASSQADHADSLLYWLFDRIPGPIVLYKNAISYSSLISRKQSVSMSWGDFARHKSSNINLGNASQVVSKAFAIIFRIMQFRGFNGIVIE